MFRRPPEIVWVGIAAGLAIWGIVAGDPLTLIACASFLATQVLASPTFRLPLWVVFVGAAAIAAGLAAGDAEFIDLIIWVLLAVVGFYEINSDYRAARTGS